MTKTWADRIETTRDNRGEHRWPAGQWDSEPDRIEWTTEAGLPGIILRQSRRTPFALAGNSVCPPLAAAIVGANVRLDEGRAAA